VIDVGLEELLKERSSFGYVGVLARNRDLSAGNSTQGWKYQRAPFVCPNI
jgi:hypothetical protein